jgi:hypothetical protein
MATSPDSMGVKDLKAELEQYGVDYSACVEKKDLVKLLTKTRTERGYRKFAFFFFFFFFFFFHYEKLFSQIKISFFSSFSFSFVAFFQRPQKQVRRPRHPQARRQPRQQRHRAAATRVVRRHQRAASQTVVRHQRQVTAVRPRHRRRRV